MSTNQYEEHTTMRIRDCEEKERHLEATLARVQEDYDAAMRGWVSSFSGEENGVTCAQTQICCQQSRQHIVARCPFSEVAEASEQEVARQPAEVCHQATETWA